MKTRFLILVGLAALVSTAASAQISCLRMDRIWNWKAVDDKTLIVEDISHQKFKMKLMVPCINLTFKNAVAFKSIGGTQLSCLEKGDEIFIHDIAMPQRCPILSVVLYTPEMQKADEAAAKAKQQQQPGH